jgi:hypothetical protein
MRERTRVEGAVCSKCGSTKILFVKYEITEVLKKQFRKMDNSNLESFIKNRTDDHSNLEYVIANAEYNNRSKNLKNDSHECDEEV